MACSGASMQTITVECRILTSTADFELYEGTKYTLMDLENCPIFDPFDMTRKKQVYHKIRTPDRKYLTLKVYPFQSFRDNTLKQAIH